MAFIKKLMAFSLGEADGAKAIMYFLFIYVFRIVIYFYL